MSGWTEEARAEKVSRLTELWALGWSDQEIALDLSCTVHTVRKMRKKEDLPPNDKRLISPERAAERRRLYDSGMSDVEIARIQGVAPESIWSWRQRNGLPPNREKGWPRKGTEG